MPNKLVQAAAEGLPRLTRRLFLGGAAATTIPASAVAVAEEIPQPLEAELPIDAAERLSFELSEVMNTYLDGRFHAIVYPSDQRVNPVAFVRTRTAQERYDYHLAELKKAAMELDPSIGHWHTVRAEDDDLSCAVLISAFRVTGRYDGDGTYERGAPNVTGTQTNYQVRLLDYRTDGHRMFEVKTSMDRMVLAEPRFNTFIGRKLV